MTADVQQVTTWSKAKIVEWEEQDGIRKAAQEWVAKANATNVERMRQDTAPGTTDAVNPIEVDPIWESLADCPITLTMSKLLNVVLRFWQAMEARLRTPHKTISTLFTEPSPGPTIIDHKKPCHEGYGAQHRNHEMRSGMRLGCKRHKQGHVH